MQGLETKISGNEISIYDPESKYALNVSLEEKKFGFLYVLFKMPYKGNKKGYMSITGRDLSEYHDDIKSLCIDPCKQYVEIGPGLGEFVHHVSRISNVGPIAIDPARYDIMLRMLEFSRSMVTDREILCRIEILAQRCKDIQEGARIHFLNMRLGDALAMHPCLCGIADYVIDNCGPSLYPLNEKSTEGIGDENQAACPINSLEMKLLKPDGKLIVRKSMA